jgi:exonuclease SbcC
MEEEANKILEEISTTGMRLELRTEKVNKNNKNVRDTLDIIISDIAGERPIELYSGGEKTRQILALAVGLAELSARKAGVKISTLLIDEPAGLDKQGLLDFGKSFIKLVESGVFKKGMLMAHEEILKEIFDQKILVTKEGTTSKVEVLV